MCTGLEIAAVAAMVAGGGLQAKSAIDTSKAQRRTSTQFAQEQTNLLRRQQEANRAAQANVEAEQAKQAALRAESQGVTEEAIKRAGRGSEDRALEDQVAKRISGFQTISDLNPVSIDLGGSKSAPSIVSESIAKSIGEATERGKQQANARAAIEATGDVGVSRDVARARDVGQLSTLSGKNRISAVLAGAEKDFVNNLARLTKSQIETSARGANQRLGVKTAKAANAKAIGDLLFMVGSAGAPSFGTAAGTPMAGGAQGPTQGSGVSGFFTR